MANLKELEQRNKELENKLTQLEEKVSKLESMLQVSSSAKSTKPHLSLKKKHFC